MVKVTVVPVIPLAVSEAMKTAMLAISSNVTRRRGWVVRTSSLDALEETLVERDEPIAIERDVGGEGAR